MLRIIDIFIVDTFQLIDLFLKILRFIQNSLQSCIVVSRQTFTRISHVGTDFVQRDPISVRNFKRKNTRRITVMITDKETSV